ncbi:MAG: hypothetical protein JWP60_3219 [Ramlibacter sp.]|nr:hypothetical protein [Ramlibacter sp.]
MLFRAVHGPRCGTVGRGLPQCGPALTTTMLLQPVLILELLLSGMAAGMLSGLLGIGGAMVLVPVLTFVLTHQGVQPEYVVKMAVATSLATIVFTSLSSVRAHARRGAVRWDIVRVLAPGIVLGSVGGAQLAVALPARMLGILFAVFITFSGTQMLLDRRPDPSRTIPGTLGMFAVGIVIGVLSALVGAGGAFVSVPFMTWCNVKIHDAVGTSAALGFPIALAASAGYAWAGRNLPQMPAGSLGYVYLPGLAVIALASMTLAPLGARIAHGMDIRPLKRIFAFVLYCIAAYFLLR